MALTISSSEWVEVPELIGASLYLQQLHDLTVVKGAGHKYVRRVPYVNPKTGKTRYRYYYNVRGGKGVGHEDEVVQGAKFKIKHGEHEGHFHVEAVDGDQVTVVHDESGHKATMSKKAFAEMIREEHAEAIKEHHDRVRDEHKKTTVPGMRKQVEKRAAKYGVELPKGEKPKPDLSVLDKPKERGKRTAKLNTIIEQVESAAWLHVRRGGKVKGSVFVNELFEEYPSWGHANDMASKTFQRLVNAAMKSAKEAEEANKSEKPKPKKDDFSATLEPHLARYPFTDEQKAEVEKTARGMLESGLYTKRPEMAAQRAADGWANRWGVKEGKAPKLAPLERADITKLVDNAETVARLIDNRSVGNFRQAAKDAFSAGEKALRGGRFAPQVENMRQDLHTIAQILRLHDRKPGFSDNPDVRKLRDQLAILGVVTDQSVEEFKPKPETSSATTPKLGDQLAELRGESGKKAEAVGKPFSGSGWSEHKEWLDQAKKATPVTVAPSRAKEIIREAKGMSKVGNWSDQLDRVTSQGEYKYISDRWNEMPGNTSYLDALQSIASGVISGKPISPRRIPKVRGNAGEEAGKLARGGYGLVTGEYPGSSLKHLKAFARAANEGSDLPDDVDMGTVLHILGDEHNAAVSDAKRGEGSRSYASAIKQLYELAKQTDKKLSTKKSMPSLTIIAPPRVEDGWMEIPTALGERFWKAYQHELLKGAGHKYIRRVPYVGKDGKTRYRYYYNVTGKRGVGHAEEIVVNAKFKVTHDGQVGHFHVTAVDGDNVTVEHDETGKSVTMTKDELRELLEKEHAHLIEAHKERTEERKKAEKKAVKKHGTEKHEAAYLKRWDAYTEKYSWLAPGGLFVAPDSDLPWTPEESPAIQDHYDLLPEKAEKLTDETIYFPNPSGKKKKCYPHQVDGAERTWTSFDKGKAMLCQDDAGLGKTITGLAALHHGIKHKGVKRALICVPGKGKAGIAKQWKDDSKLFGIDIRDANKDKESMENMEEGVWQVAYDHHEFYETKIEEVWNEERECWQKIKKVELKPWLKDFDMVIFDESHNLAGTGQPGEMSNIAVAGAQFQQNLETNNVLYLSATPFTNVRDMHYLRKMGWFNNGEEFKDWAEQVGCTIEAGECGDIPAKIINPTTALPMVQIAAVSHVDGTSIKRTTTLEGLDTGFRETALEDLLEAPGFESTMKEHKGKTLSEIHPELENFYTDAVKTFEIAEKIFEVAQEGSAGMLAALKTNWRKSYWETLKVCDAIKAGEEALATGKQVGFFTNYHQYSNSIIGGAGPERGFGNSFRERAAEKAEEGDWEGAQKDMEYASRIDALAERLPPSTNPVDILVKHFGGKDKVAEAHGRTNKALTAEQDAFQDGYKKVMVGTMAKAGTGLSWHDDEGIAPRVQINLGLPWTGTAFVQVAGRMHRLGSESDTIMHWLIGDNETEQRNAATVAHRLRSMGALVSGDPDMAPDAAMLAAFESGLDVTAEDMDELLNIDLDEEGEEPKKKKGQTEEGQEARDHFRSYAEARHAGQDVPAEEHERRKQERLKKVRHAARKIGAGLLKHGIHIGPDADPEKFRAFGVGYDGKGNLRQGVARIRKGKEKVRWPQNEYILTMDALLKLADNYNVALTGRTGILSEEEFELMQNPAGMTHAERQELAHKKEALEYRKTPKKERALKVNPDDRRRAEGVGVELEKDKIVIGEGKKAKKLVEVTLTYDTLRWRGYLRELAKSDPVAAENQPYGSNRVRIPDDRLEEFLGQITSGSTVDPEPVSTTTTVPPAATPTTPPPSEQPKVDTDPEPKTIPPPSSSTVGKTKHLGSVGQVDVNPESQYKAWMNVFGNWQEVGNYPGRQLAGHGIWTVIDQTQSTDTPMAMFPSGVDPNASAAAEPATPDQASVQRYADGTLKAGTIVRIGNRKRRFVVAGSSHYGTEAEYSLSALSGGYRGSSGDVKASQVVVDDDQSLVFSGVEAEKRHKSWKKRHAAKLDFSLDPEFDKVRSVPIRTDAQIATKASSTTEPKPPPPPPAAEKSVTQRAKAAGFTIGGLDDYRGIEVVLVTGPKTKEWKENIKDHSKRGGLAPRDAWDKRNTGWRVPVTELEALVKEFETGTPKEAPKRSSYSRYGRRSYYRGMPDNQRLVIRVPRS
jgi:hypothetical protein